MSDTPRNPIGRPSLYRPEYCEQVVQVMREGLSLLSFAASIDVSRRTITEWMMEHEEFSLAVSRGKAISAAWYELQQKKLIESGGSSSQATLIVFGLKNMASDEWKDKIVNEHQGKDGGAIQVTISKDDADL